MMDDAKIENALQVAVTRLGFTEAKEAKRDCCRVCERKRCIRISAYWLREIVMLYLSIPFLFDTLGLKTDEILGVGSVIVIVTPLITIMKEQSAMLTSKGVPAMRHPHNISAAPRSDQKYLINDCYARIIEHVMHSIVTRWMNTIPQTLKFLAGAKRGWARD